MGRYAGRVVRVMNWADGAGVCASTACLIHCLGLPLAIAALPALANGVPAGEGFHVAMLAFAAPISALALVAAWRRHRVFALLAFGTTGLALMVAAVAFTSLAAFEMALTVTGSLLLAAAHIANWRLRRSGGNEKKGRLLSEAP